MTAGMKRPLVPPPLSVSALGTDALLFDCQPPMSLALQERILMVADELSHQPGVEEAVPGMNNLMLVFDSTQVDSAQLQAVVNQAWLHPKQTQRVARDFELPVVYGGEYGIDLEHVAAHNGISTQEVIELHCAATYTVFFSARIRALHILADCTKSCIRRDVRSRVSRCRRVAFPSAVRRRVCRRRRCPVAGT